MSFILRLLRHATQPVTQPSNVQQPAQQEDFGSNAEAAEAVGPVTFTGGGGFVWQLGEDGSWTCTASPDGRGVGNHYPVGDPVHDIISDQYRTSTGQELPPVAASAGGADLGVVAAEAVEAEAAETGWGAWWEEVGEVVDEAVESVQDVAEDLLEGAQELIGDVTDAIQDGLEDWGLLAGDSESETETETETEGGGTEAAATQGAETAPDNDPFTVARGQLTFDAEGTEGGRYHTRTAHWPGGASGVTIGRGYDLGQQTRSGILSDMATAGIGEGDAEAFAAAQGLSGTAARDWLAANRDSLPEISPEQQELLFEITYGRLAADVERISGNYARIVSEREGGEREDYEVDWATLNPAIRDLVVDLRYRGDYTPGTRVWVQPLAIANDLPGLLEVMSDRTKWSSVPQDRFNRRVAFLRAAVEGGNQPSLEGSGPVAQGGGVDNDTGPAEGGGAEGAAPQVSTDNAGQVYQVAATSLNVRSSPNSDSNDNRIGSLASGARITATGRSAEWIQFTYQGQVGWVSGNHLREVDENESTGATASGDNQLSGAAWYGIANANGWSNSTDFDDLSPEFGPKAERFVEGLRSSGARVEITAGLRHEKRAILMHFAWHVSHGTKSVQEANTYCQTRGIAIEWDHGDAGTSRRAAADLVARFGLVRSASLTSNHMGGNAIDMKITNVPATLEIGGTTYQAGPQGGGVLEEDKVDHIGRALGVIWYGPGDYVHWSLTGR